MRHAKIITAATSILATIAMAAPSLAKSKLSECQGRLHQDKTGILIGGGHGEDESICVIEKSEQAKVLAICVTERPCRIRGQMEDCKDSGECAEFSKIISVKKQ